MNTNKQTSPAALKAKITKLKKEVAKHLKKQGKDNEYIRIQDAYLDAASKENANLKERLSDYELNDKAHRNHINRLKATIAENHNDMLKALFIAAFDELTLDNQAEFKERYPFIGKYVPTGDKITMSPDYTPF